MDGPWREDGLDDAEIAAMVATLQKASGLKDGSMSSAVETVYQLKSAVEMTSTTDLDTAEGKRGVAEAIASSNPKIKDASDVVILGATVVGSADSGKRRHLAAEEQSFRIDYELSISRSQAGGSNVNPKEAAEEIKNAMQSPTFKAALSQSGIEATVTKVEPTQVAAKLIFTVEAEEGEDVSSSLDKMVAHASSPTFTEELEANGVKVEQVKGSYVLSASPPPLLSPPPLVVPPLPSPPPKRDSQVAGPRIHPFTRSFVHPSILSFTRSFVHPSIHSFTVTTLIIFSRLEAEQQQR